MPIYEYKCDKCGKDFEVFQGISDPPVTACRFCKGRVRKQMSLSSFQLKGSGWYTTDYGGKKPLEQHQDTSAPETDTKKDTAPSGTTSED